MDRDTEPPRPFGDGWPRHRRLGAPVVGRVDTANPVRNAAGSHGLGFGCTQDPAMHLEVAGAQGPGFPLREVRLACRDVEQAGPAKARIDAELLVEAAPQFEALHRQRQLAQIAVLLAAPAPIAAGLLARDAAL